MRTRWSIAIASAALVGALLLAACGGGSEAFPTATPALTIEVPISLGTPTTGTPEPGRTGVFPVNLKLPGTGVSVWTTVRREGDPERDEELTFIVEGYVEATEGYFFDYTVLLTDDADQTYETKPAFRLGLLAPGILRKFELAADLPREARVKRIHFRSGDGDKSRDLVYHIDLAVARIPTIPLVPPRWNEAQ